MSVAMATKRWSELGPQLRRCLNVGRAVVRDRYPLIAGVAVVLFLAGAWYSFHDLDVSPRQLKAGPLAALVALAPVTLVYSGIGMWLLARSARGAIPLGRATTISTFANLAEALPLPGGAIVRAGALMAVGTGAGESSLLVILSAVMWISLACLACGVALLSHGHAAAMLLTVGGLAGTATAFSWLLWRAGPRNAISSLLHRLAGMVLIGLRLHLAFMALGLTLPLADAMPFALATIAGSAASLAPAGLGISELLAAMVAGTVNVPPSAAFLAAGIDRVVALAASGLYALVVMGANRTVNNRSEPA